VRGEADEMNESIVLDAVKSRDPIAAEKAFKEYDVAIQRSFEPTDKARLLLGKAVLYGVFLRFQECRNALQLALEQSPEDPDIRLEADCIGARLYDQENKPREALEHLTAVFDKYYQRFKTEPDLHFAYQDIQLRRGLNAVRLGKFRDAIGLLKESSSFPLKRHEMSDVFANLGVCFSELGEFESAREYFLKTLEIGPTRQWEGEVHMRLAVAYAKLGFLKEAKREFQSCEQKASEYAVHGIEINKTYRWLAWVCRGLGEDVEALQYANLARPI
jgi:tetratricopeptide (TPR) repeat protein